MYDSTDAQFQASADRNQVDTCDDEDQWQPPQILQTDKPFPPTKCHGTLTFQHFCNLGEVCLISPYQQNTED
jgi:hypothetical protein